MNNSLENLLQQVFELEGLVALAIKRGVDVPQMVLSMIGSKAAAIADSAKAITVEAPEEAETPLCNGIDALPDDTPDDDITVELIDDTNTQQYQEEKPELGNNDEASATTEEKAVENNAAPTASECELQSQEAEAEPGVTAATEEDADIIEQTADVQEQASESLAETAAQSASNGSEENGITLDEALQRDMTKDLRHAFSLNDRYRYRRELFGNSDSVMNETLNLVETMHTFDEAEDYFYNDLQWDHESPEVADFMVIIKNHFWNKRQQV